MNIRTLVMAATFMPAIALAQVATTAQDTTYTQQSATVSNTYDTTFVFNSQKFAISQNGERTNVSVYKKCGTEMKRSERLSLSTDRRWSRCISHRPLSPKGHASVAIRSIAIIRFSSLVATCSQARHLVSSRKVRKCATASRVNGDLRVVRSSVL